MKNCLFILLLSPFLTVGQIEPPVMYRGIENKLLIASKNFRLLCEDTSIRIDQNKDSVICFIPALYNFNELEIVKQNIQTGQIEEKICFAIVFLPNPIINLKSAYDGPLRLIAKTELKNVDATFEITKNKIEMFNPKSSAFCLGNTICLGAYLLFRNMTLNQLFYITTTVAGNDGIYRNIKTNFKN